MSWCKSSSCNLMSPRVVLMSATLDAESFAEYFSSPGGAPCRHISVPTEPRHPVEVHYLEDVADDALG